MNHFNLKKLLQIYCCFYCISFCYSQDQNYSLYDYINKYKDIAVKERQLYRIPASITLAQGIIESANGNSLLARKSNNHFGIKCHSEWSGGKFYADDDAENECFRVYESVEESFRNHSEFLKNQPRYRSLFSYDILDYIDWAYGLQDCGYATNPMYAVILVSIIQKHELYKFDWASNVSEEKNIETQKKVVNVTKADPEPLKHLALSPYTTGHGRNIFLNNNLKCILATHTDDITLIAQELGIKLEKIYKFNDMVTGENVEAMDLIYIEAKLKNSWKKFHEVETGETMHSISQRFGVRIKNLYKYNMIPFGIEPVAGQLLRLSKT